MGKKPASKSAPDQPSTTPSTPPEHCCGPAHDAEFFEAVAKVMRQFPDACKKYAIKCIDHETDLMGIDFEKSVGVSSIRGKTITTEFVDAGTVEPSRYCCLWWVWPGGIRCIAYW